MKMMKMIIYHSDDSSAHTDSDNEDGTITSDEEIIDSVGPGRSSEPLVTYQDLYSQPQYTTRYGRTIRPTSSDASKMLVNSDQHQFKQVLALPDQQSTINTDTDNKVVDWSPSHACISLMLYFFFLIFSPLDRAWPSDHFDIILY
jgi:hypothetical protein